MTSGISKAMKDTARNDAQIFNDTDNAKKLSNDVTGRVAIYEI